MIDLFLRAKHWQLFALTFILPMIFQFVVMGSMFTNIETTTPPDPSFMAGYMSFFPIIMVICMGVMFGWFWSVAIGLQRRIPEGIDMKVNRFKIFFFTPMVYLLCMTFFMGFMMNGLASEQAEPSGALIGSLIAVIIPLHLFSMFCMFYNLYYVAKTFKTAELQRDVSFSDFAGEFFMIWFFPVGIWIIQPKVNRMIEE